MEFFTKRNIEEYQKLFKFTKVIDEANKIFDAVKLADELTEEKIASIILSYLKLQEYYEEKNRLEKQI